MIKVILAIIIILLLCIYIGVTVYQKIKTYYLFKGFGYQRLENTYKELNYEYVQTKNIQIDKQLLNDLEIPLFFNQMNYTYTTIGREYLFASFFEKNINLASLNYKVNQLKDEKVLKKTLYEMYVLSKNYSESLEIFEKKNVLMLKQIILCALFNIVFCLSLILTLLNIVNLLPYLFMLFSFQMIYYNQLMKKTDYIIQNAEHCSFVFHTLNKFNKLSLFENKKSISSDLRKVKKYFTVYEWSQKYSQYDIFYLLEMLKALTFYPMYQTYIFLKHEDEIKDTYLNAYKEIGEIDVALSIICINSQYQTCEPQVSREKGIQAKGCYHPLLKNPISNDFDIQQSALITGSNASGKSTFIKTVGLNMLVAQTLNIAFASSFVYCPMNVYSSIHQKDDISQGDSYFVSEIKTLKNIVKQTKEGQQLILIDEILRGTNEKERIIISKAILSYLFKTDSLVLVTTHDLTIIENFLDVQQYCFNDQIKDNQLHYDYKLKEGISYVGNATKLLKIYEFEEEILNDLEL